MYEYDTTTTTITTPSFTRFPPGDPARLGSSIPRRNSVYFLAFLHLLSFLLSLSLPVAGSPGRQRHAKILFVALLHDFFTVVLSSLSRVIFLLFYDR